MNKKQIELIRSIFSGNQLLVDNLCKNLSKDEIIKVIDKVDKITNYAIDRMDFLALPEIDL